MCLGTQGQNAQFSCVVDDGRCPHCGAYIGVAVAQHAALCELRPYEAFAVAQAQVSDVDDELALGRSGE